MDALPMTNAAVRRAMRKTAELFMRMSFRISDRGGVGDLNGQLGLKNMNAR
jgi:hypothetical protein